MMEMIRISIGIKIEPLKVLLHAKPDDEMAILCMEIRR